MKHKIIVAAFLACTTSISAYAHSNATGDVLKRMMGMKAIQAATKTLAEHAKAQTPFNADLVASNAQALVVHAREIPKLFEPKDLSPPSESRPELWQNFSDFTRQANTLEKAALRAQNAKDRATLKAAIREIGKSCSSCHEAYRVKK